MKIRREINKTENRNQLRKLFMYVVCGGVGENQKLSLKDQ